MISEVGTDQLITLGAFGVGLSVLSLNDAASSENIRRNYAGSPFLRGANKIGDIKIAAGISVGLFGTSMFTNNTKFQDAAFTSLQALLMANLTVNAGKFLFARERPIHSDGPYDLEFAETGATSFPSGHSATAFALVTPWVMYYPGPLTYSLMAIPVGTAIARIAKGRHWLSDVTAGAAIGFSFGHYLAKKHLNLESDNIQFIPSAGSNKFSLTVNFRF